MENTRPSPGDSGHTTTPIEPPISSTDSSINGESPRLFIVCGRDRKVEEVRDLFAQCGAIRQLHLATDRSNKSRGFAFLQYEDPTSAAVAIKQFDKTTLGDGHVLKVTVAREKSRTPASATVKVATQPGKLKRNQHSQDDSDGKGDDGSATDGGASSGKRQRSSPPSSISSASSLQKIWKRATPFANYVIARRSPEDEIADVLGGIIAQIENKMHGEDVEAMEKTGKPAYVVPAAAKRKALMTLVRTAVDAEEQSGSGESIPSRPGCENVQPCKLKSQRTTVAQVTPKRPVPQAESLRSRRRVPIDESDSSVEDASDASVGRRKRSNTEPDEVESNLPGSANSRRRLSDLRELSLSPTGVSSPMTSKKRCSRRSSASSSSSLPGYQPTPFRPLAPVFVPAIAPSLTPRPIRRRRMGPHATLFFTSTVKFTLQELEAMFSVYEQFEYVQMTKSFGRLKTMAYVKYASLEAASSVLTSFLDDNEGEDHGMIKLTYADNDEPTPRFPFQPPSNRRVMTNTAGESTSSEVHTRLVDVEFPLVTSTENCWLMILYDRGLTNEAISSCATSCEGMEFIDIKMFRSTGESQGVAFVKFETEELAQAASQQLHNSEFPTGSRKFLQAIVIADPALFSTAHGASSSSSTAQSSGQVPLASSHHPGEDGDLGFVEARFAHLMSGTNDQSNGSISSMANAISADEEIYPTPLADVGSTTFVQHARPPLSHPTPAPYGYFQFGQPFPYNATSHPHQPHAYHQQPPFYPQGFSEPQPWCYDDMYSMWSGETDSLIPSDYTTYSGESATPRGSFGPTRSPQPDVTSVFVSSSRPLDLSSLMKAIQECPGVVGFSKEERDGFAYVVNFGEPRLAAEAVNKLDGTTCNGNKLRVAVASGHRPPPSRRKRQRLDQRGRRK